MGQSKKKWAIINALLYKCPKCQKGDLFEKPLNLTKPLAMPKNCKICNLRFEPEPGFYYGAMFISYVMSGFFFLGIAGVCIIFFDWSVNAAFGLILVLAAAIYLFVLRCSRSIWINLVTKYDPPPQASEYD